MRSVVKHSYIKGANRGVRAAAHINYIQYRSGEDRGKEPRSFFDDKREGLLGRDVKADLEQNGGKVVHKLILSPGVEGVDMQAYSRAVMSQISREKGMDLEWRAVEHRNTDHDHTHVVVFGKDKLGKEVQFRREDHALMREYGDRYLARQHEWDRYLDRDLERFMRAPDYTPVGDERYKRLLEDLKRDQGESKEPAKEPYKAKEWDKEKALEHLPEKDKIEAGEQSYSKYSSLEELKALDERLKAGEQERIPYDQYQKLHSWIGTKERAGEDFHEKQAKRKWDKKEKKREERAPGEDDREHRKLDKDLKKAMQEYERGSGEGDGLGRGYRERLRETLGRRGADHGHYTAQAEIQRLKEQAEADPSRKEELDQKIEELQKWDREQRDEGSRWKNLDDMLGERYGREQQELAQLLKPREVPLPERQPEQEKEAQEQAKEPAKELEQEQEKQPEVKVDRNRWQELDSILGDRYGQQDYTDRMQAKELQHQQSQQQMRQFQDLHNSEIQKPELEREDLDRDDGEDLFARGER